MATERRGGYRENAGRKPAGYIPPVARADYDEAKARNEQAKAELNELELAIKRGQYVLRVEVEQQTATALAALAQGLRSVPDNLERTLGVSPEVAQTVSNLIDAALDDLAQAFESVVEQARAQETQYLGKSDADDLL